MTPIEYLIDLHRNTNRQGPGSDKDTLKALNFIKFQNKEGLEIVDMGCGTGGQTFQLANKLNGEIIALDFSQEFLDELQKKAHKNNLLSQITPLLASMEDHGFKQATKDLIWSEGAIYNIGFRKGIKEWSALLKTNGFLAVSEITWITPSRPSEIENYWNKHYSEINTASNKIKIMEESGLTIVGYFYLPQSSWLKYYEDLEKQFEPFLKRHQYNKDVSRIVEEHKAEIDLYMKYKDYYSYGFYIAQKK